MAYKGKKTKFTGKLHIKKGDKVIVLAGKDKGSEGEVMQVFPAKNRAIVEGVNMVTKHQKPDHTNEGGGLISQEAAIHISNLMLIDPSNGKPTRVGRREEAGKLVRYSKKTGEIIA